MDGLKKHIVLRLKGNIESFEDGNFKYWVIDNLLPDEIAIKIARAFPEEDKLRQRDSLREYKRVGVDFDSYDKLMEQITCVFHDADIVNCIEDVTGIQQMIPDGELYAGGLSSMTKNSFLNPHLDNSHDDSRTHYRVLNLLYYVSEDWKTENGGNLVLFPYGMDKDSVTVTSFFNRLVLMETHDKSYHGVSKVKSEVPRRCVSNYYFSKKPTVPYDYDHVTSFYRFPEEKSWKGLALMVDRNLRTYFASAYKRITKHQNWHKRK
jgi:Rps23 Pro-64 3,4-dihydroxylase Tpa1-like proline 4-hydroxylase